MLEDAGLARPAIQRTDETGSRCPPQRGDAVAVDDDRWFLAIGPLGAGPVVDDLTEIAGQRAG